MAFRTSQTRHLLNQAARFEGIVPSPRGYTQGWLPSSIQTLKQSNAIRKDLDTFAASPSTATPGLQGALSTSLSNFNRLISSYEETTKSELNEAKKEKAAERLKNFRADAQSYRQQFDELKRQREESVAVTNRSELLGRRPHHAATPENPYDLKNASSSQSPFAPKPGSQYAQQNGGASFGSGDHAREDHALREQSFFAQANSQIDEYLDRGRAVLGDLGQQKEILKGTQRKLYSVANTLGVSGDTIRMVERRAKQDKWIFWGGVIGFFAFCFLVVYFLK